MPCYSPLQAWRGPLAPSGKRSIIFRRPSSAREQLSALKLPCGQCIGCRLERSRQWAIRCVHEASLYDRNCFITLTYDDAHLPNNSSLVLRDFQLFMKRLRKFANQSGIRFFHCGEYGETYFRPHYHACLFNYDFSDKKIFRLTDRGDKLWRSDSLDSLWSKGYTMLGSVTFESAAYVARYVMKKVTGEPANEHYVNKSSGELRSPEYVTMSRRPGIGRGWYDQYKSDVYPRDYTLLRGMKVRPPKFYDSLFELDNPKTFAILKLSRIQRALTLDPTGFGETGNIRLAVKEKVKRSKIATLRRSLEV